MGGYNEAMGPLNLVESFSMEQRTWKKHSQMNVERINPGCCTFGHNYVYVFGGRGTNPKDEFYDSIERLNTDLNLWSFIKVRLPSKLCNLYAFPVKNDYILILGGLKKVTVEPVQEDTGSSSQRENILSKNIANLQREQQVDRNVYLYS